MLIKNERLRISPLLVPLSTISMSEQTYHSKRYKLSHTE
jgi:hypothetical protein